jgi:hypothetical protein
MEFEDWELLNYPKVSNLLECDGRLDKKKRVSLLVSSFCYSFSL